jgi:hypothetical protein
MKTFDIMEENRKRGVVPPKGRRIVPIGNVDRERYERANYAFDYLAKLGYDLGAWDTPSYKNKYYNEKKYDETANKIDRLIRQGKDVPQEYIDYMLKVKKIKEKYNLN